MDELVFNKNNFNIKELNSIIEQFCNNNSMNKEKVLNLQLVAEEFLSNILFILNSFKKTSNKFSNR